MTFNTNAKPAGWIVLTSPSRNNVILDEDLVEGDVVFSWDYYGSEVVNEFNHPDGTQVSGLPTDRGLEVWETWSSFTQTGWTIQNNAAVYGGSNHGYMMLDFSASTGGNGGVRSFEARFTITSGSVFIGVGTKDISSSRGVYCTVGSRMSGPGGFLGTTTGITAGEHTVRIEVQSVAVPGSTVYKVYLDGVDQGTVTATTSTDSGSPDCFGFGDINPAVGVALLDFTVDELVSLDAATWTVVDALGNEVATGDFSEPTISFPDPGYGWYHLRCHGTDREDGNRGWRDSYGDCYFGRTPTYAHDHARPAKSERGVFEEFDEVIHGFLNNGPTRPIAVSNNFTSVAAQCAKAQEWWCNGADGVRPRRTVVTFADGSANWNSGGNNHVPNHVNAYGTTYDMVWDPFNEPGTINTNYRLHVPERCTDFINNELIEFYDRVTAVDPDAIVITPSIVGLFEGGDFTWMDNFFGSGVFTGRPNLHHSFHGYNLMSGLDIGRCRRLLDVYMAKLAQYGVDDRPIWQTEAGGINEQNGILQPMSACQETALQVFMQECYGIIHERNVYWYDRSHGFDSYPGMQYGHNNTNTGLAGDVLPGPLMMHTLDAELRGTVLDERFDFRSAADMYVGARFTRADGTATIGLMAQSAECPDIRLHVTGATSLTRVDAWGNEDTVDVTGGIALIDMPALMPVWLRLPAGVNAFITEDDYEWGDDFALATNGSSVAAAGTNMTLSAVLPTATIDGTHHSIGGYYPLMSRGKYSGTTPTWPWTWTVNLGQARDINCVVVRLRGCTDVELQTSANGTDWTTRTHYQRTNPTIRFAGNGRCFSARYEDPAEMLTWRQDDTVSATHVRVKINGAMWSEVYIPAFENEDQANEAYEADTSTWPMGYLVSVGKISAFGAPSTEVPNTFILLHS